jgi:hypothetical protein
MRNFINLIEGFIDAKYRVGTRTSITTQPDVLNNPAFIKWFGKSKVSTTDGHPLVCYHGTYQDFTTFKPIGDNKLSHAFNRLGYWFDVNAETPSHFAGYQQNLQGTAGSVMPCFLRIVKPFFLDSEYVFDSDRDELVAARNAYFDLHKEVMKGKAGSNLMKKTQEAEKNYNKLKKELEEIRSDGFWRLMKLLPNGAKSSSIEVAEFRDMLMSEGHDGIYLGDTTADWGTRGHKVTDWWITFHPNQIKSIYSKEFNPDSEHVSEQKK